MRLGPIHFLCFPVHRARAVEEHWIFYFFLFVLVFFSSGHTQNGHLVHREERWI